MTAIEWTDQTWNPVVGCRRVSPGCEHCYAETMAKRLGAMGQRRYLGLVTDRGRWTGEVRMVPEVLDRPLRWRKPRRVFVNSMSDLFHPDVPFDFIAAVFGVIAACPQHTFQVLTKRPERAAEFFRWAEAESATVSMLRDGMPSALLTCAWEAICGESAWGVADPPFDDVSPSAEVFGTAWPLPNVWLGVSVEDQQRADERIPLLLQCPAAVRFVSCEPLLGPIDLCEMRNEHGLGEGQDFVDALHGSAWTCTGPDYVDTCPIGLPLDWVIVGGESGPGARPCAVNWIESVVDQCRQADVPVFVKQLGAFVVDEHRCDPDTGEWAWRAGLTDRKGGDPTEWPEDLRVRQWPVVAP